MPVLSMTGFGQAKSESKQVSLSVEVKTVNHRFLDINFKLPNQYASFEPKLSKLVKDKVARGRIEIYVAREEHASGNSEVRLNSSLFSNYTKAVRKALKEAQIASNEQAFAQAVVAGLQRREILDVVSKSSDAASELKLVSQTVSAAIDDMIRMRKAEGQALLREVQRLLKEFSRSVNKVKALADTDVKEIQKRIRERVAKLFPDMNIDPERLAMEAAVLAEKADVTEELARLDSHIKQFDSLLGKDGSGRKMEFLIQEMGREVNTLGTKAQKSKISEIVVDVKGLLEKLREQVANIE